MTRNARLRRWALTTLLGLLLTFAAPGRSDDVVAGAWIIVGGGNKGTKEAVGTILYGTFANLVTPKINTATQADGFIFVGVSEHCAHPYHYHGKLFGKEDTGEECGWGAVVPWTQTEGSFYFASAIEEELAAVALLEKNPAGLPCGPGAGEPGRDLRHGCGLSDRP